MSDGKSPWVVLVVGQDGSLYSRSSRGSGSSECRWDVVVYVHRVVGIGAHNGFIHRGVHRGDVTKDEVGMAMEEDGWKVLCHMVRHVDRGIDTF
jgi:hypothetical protein